MNRTSLLLISTCICILSCEVSTRNDEAILLEQIMEDPSAEECRALLDEIRHKDLQPRDITVHDSLVLSNANILYVLSHTVEGNKHYGAVIVPDNHATAKLPVMILATGGDGIHSEFDITTDFNHDAAQFPNLLGNELDKDFIIVIPCFRGQQLIIGQKQYQSEGKVSDAFDGATTDALALLNVVLHSLSFADEARVGIYGGSRGGTVALLAASRDKRIKGAVAIAAPTDMKGLHRLFPEQFKILFLDDLFAGKISVDEARKKCIASSPVFFAGELPRVQLHYDLNDPFVPADFATKLSIEMIAKSRVNEQYFYNEGIHGFWSDARFWRSVQEFAKQLRDL